MEEKLSLKLDALLVSIIQKIRTHKSIFAKYSEYIEWLSLSKLLFSIIEMEKKHEERLLTIKDNLSRESWIIKKDEVKGPQDFFSDLSFTKEMSYTDFLTMLIHYFNRHTRMYTYLSSVSRDTENRKSFMAMANEVKKQKHWVLDRFELEILTIL